MRFCLLLVLLSASCFAMEAGESRIPHDIESKFINFCQIIQQRDIIYEFNKQEAVQGKVFTPKESFQLSRHIKSGGTYRYDDKSIDLVFQIPYSIEKIAGSPTLLCRYEKGKGNNTLNFFLKGLGRYCGIIEGYDNWKKSEIREFANNILAILERDSIVLHQKSHDIVTPALQIGALVFTSERLRSEKSLLLAYIEFLKLKGNPSPERLKKMFLGERPSLRFPKGQDCVFFASIPELLSEFSDLYTVYKTEKPGEFFDDVIWKLWKLHEVHWDFAQVLDGFASFPINPYVSYMIVPLINSSPKSLYRKLFNKDKTPVELIKTTLIQIPSMEYCQFIFAAAPQMFIQHLLTNNNLDNYLKSILDCGNPDFLYADWILTKITESGNIETAKEAIESFIDRVLLPFGNIPKTAYFSLLKFTQYINELNWQTFFRERGWLTERWKKEHLERNLVRAIVDEYLQNKSQLTIFNMSIRLGFNNPEFVKKIEEELKQIKSNQLESIDDETPWIEMFRSGIDKMLVRFRSRRGLVIIPKEDDMNIISLFD